MIWIVRGIVLLLAAFWIGLLVLGVVARIRKRPEAEWSVIGWFAVGKVQPTVVPLSIVFAITFWDHTTVLWVGGAVFVGTLLLRWGLVRIAAPESEPEREVRRERAKSS